MRSPGIGKLVVATSAGALLLASTSLIASAQDNQGEVVNRVSGSAQGAVVSLFNEVFDDGVTHSDFPRIAFVELPPDGGGPFTDSVPFLSLGVTEPEPHMAARDLEVSTEGALGADGFATSNASVAGLFEDDTLLGDLLQIDLVEVECRSDMTGRPTGSTTITGGAAADPETGEVAALPESPVPGTVVADFEVELVEDGFVENIALAVVLNEQLVEGDEITVTGVSVDFQYELVNDEGPDEGVELEVVFGQVSCGIETGEAPAPEPPGEIDPEVVAQPRFTG